MLDRPYADEIDTLVADRRSGALSTSAFCTGVLGEANPYNAHALLAYLPDTERSEFEWWFVATFGNRLEPRTFHIAGVCGGPEQLRVNPIDPEDTRRAVHRAILARREPI